MACEYKILVSDKIWERWKEVTSETRGLLSRVKEPHSIPLTAPADLRKDAERIKKRRLSVAADKTAKRENESSPIITKKGEM